MLCPENFVRSLQDNGIDSFFGVPDSLLKNICAYISDNLEGNHNIITANEGAAIGLAAGHYLATGRPACVYMQNSGEGNIINPLASLTDPEVYNIPVLLLIGWRGKPGQHDEPQHIKQGKITTGLLNVMGVNYDVLSQDEEKAQKQIVKAVEALNRNEVYALIVEKDTFEQYALQNVKADELPLSREEAIQIAAGAAGGDDCVVSTTGMISRELYEYRDMMGQSHERDFLTVGSMGHASQIALGIALAQPERKVWCFDGDGAMLMHMGNLPIVATCHPANYVHVVFNNGAHDSVGGQPTVGLDIDVPALGKAVGYPVIYSVSSRDELLSVLAEVKAAQSLALVEIKVRKGNRKDLGRPKLSPVQNKEALMNFLKK